MQPLNIKLEDKGEFVIMHLSGSAQAVSKQSEEVLELRNHFKELASQNMGKVLVNLKAVDYLASSTIGAFLSGNSILKKIGGKLVLYNASDYLTSIFDIVELHKVLPICKSYEEAIETVKSD